MKTIEKLLLLYFLVGLVGLLELPYVQASPIPVSEPKKTKSKRGLVIFMENNDARGLICMELCRANIECTFPCWCNMRRYRCLYP